MLMGSGGELASSTSCTTGPSISVRNAVSSDTPIAFRCRCRSAAGRSGGGDCCWCCGGGSMSGRGAVWTSLLVRVRFPAPRGVWDPSAEPYMEARLYAPPPSPLPPNPLPSLSPPKWWGIGSATNPTADRLLLIPWSDGVGLGCSLECAADDGDVGVGRPLFLLRFMLTGEGKRTAESRGVSGEYSTDRFKLPPDDAVVKMGSSNGPPMEGSPIIIIPPPPTPLPRSLFEIVGELILLMFLLLLPPGGTSPRDILRRDTRLKEPMKGIPF